MVGDAGNRWLCHVGTWIRGKLCTAPQRKEHTTEGKAKKTIYEILVIYW